MVAVVFAWPLVLTWLAESSYAVCPGSCLNPDQCDPVSGYCKDYQCAYGWTNRPACDKPCQPLTWGINCLNTCRCPMNDTCSIINGVCGTERCASSWYGTGCQYRMTELYSPPSVITTLSNGSMLQWSRWSIYTDYGDGPIGSYTMQTCQGAVTESCWKSGVTVFEPNSTYQLSTLSLWVPGIPNTTYSYRIVANMWYLGSILPGAPGRPTPPVLLPPLPANLSAITAETPSVNLIAVSLNASTATLIWQQPRSNSASQPAVAAYSITYFPVLSLADITTCRPPLRNDQTNVTLSVADPQTSLTLVSLQPYTQYAATIKVVYAGNYTSNSSEATFTTGAAAPRAAISNVTVSSVTSTSVNVSWLSVSCQDITGAFSRFELNISSDGSSNIVGIYDVRATAATLANLLPVTWYSAAVRLVNTAGPGPWSLTSRFQTMNQVPPPPSSVRVITTSPSSATVYWTLANTTVTINNVSITVYGYGGQGCFGAEAFVMVKVVPVIEGKQLDLINLTSWTQYRVQLQTVNELGISVPAAYSFVTASSAPVTQVSILGSDLQTSGSQTKAAIIFFWNALPCEAIKGLFIRYDVEYTVEGLSYNGTSNYSYFSVQTISTTANYTVRVRAVNDAGPGPWGVPYTLEYAPPLADAATRLVSNLSASITSTNSSTGVQLQWQTPGARSGLTGYVLTYQSMSQLACQLAYVQGAAVSQQLNASHIAVQILGLKPYTLYVASVRAVYNSSSAGGDSAVSTSFVTDSVAPSVPIANITVSNITSRSALVKWQAISCQDLNGVLSGYDVLAAVQADQGSPLTTSVLASEPTAVWLQGLQPNTLYNVSIRAVNGKGAGPWSYVGSPYRTANEAPATVSALSVGNVTQTAAAASWLSPARNFSVTLTNLGALACGGARAESIISVSWSQTSTYRFFGLFPWTRYRVQVIAYNDIAASTASITDFTTRSSLPTANVTGLVSSYVADGNRLLLAWAPVPCDDVNGVFLRYDVTIMVNGTTMVANGSTTTQLYQLYPLLPTTNYSSQVRVVNDVGPGAWSAVVTLVSPYKTAPSPVTSLRVVVSSNEAYVSWDLPPNGNQGATYTIAYELLNAGACTKLATPLLVQSVPLTATLPANASVTGLQPWSSYRVTVTARNDVATSVAFANFSTMASAPIATVADVAVSDVTSSSALCSWRAPPCDTWTGSNQRYRYVLLNSSGSEVVNNQTAGTSVLLTALRPYRQYSISLQIVNDVAGGPMSYSVNFSSSLALPAMVQSISISVITPYSALVTWRAPIDSFVIAGYEVSYQRLALGNCVAEPDPVVSKVVSGSTVTSKSIDQLQPWSLYGVWVSAFNQLGYSPNVSAQFNTTYDVPALPPSNVTGVASEFGQVTYAWAAPDCVTARGPLVAYDYTLSPRATSAVVRNGSTVSLNVTFSGLLAYTEYSFAVRTRNVAGSGPTTVIATVRTLPADPAPPADVVLLPATNVDTSTQMLLNFSNTDPAVVTSYRVTYQVAASISTVPAAVARSVEGIVNNSDAVIVVQLKDLLPYTTYRIQVGLGTAAGWGQMSKTVNLTTGSSRPSPPRSLRLVSSNETSLQLIWEVPQAINGPLRNYQLSYTLCSSAPTLTCSVDGSAYGIASTQTLQDLCPGACYAVSVIAATDKGPGNATVMQFWTVLGQPVTPAPPEVTGTTASTVTLKIYPVPPMYGPIAAYQIGVNESKAVRKRAAMTDVIPESFLVYVDVPAQEVVRNGFILVVGDNRTSAGGQYTSLPLKAGTSYNIILVVKSTLNNVTKVSISSVTMVSTLPVATVPTAEVVAAGYVPLWVPIVVAVVVLVILLLVALAVVLFLCHRRKRRREKAYGNAYGNHTFMSSDGDLAAAYENQLQLMVDKPIQDSRTEDDELITSPAQQFWHGLWSPIYTIRSPRYVLKEPLAEDMVQDSPCISFEQEFNQLPRGRQGECRAALQPINTELNRFSHILPYDHSRVTLRHQPHATETDYVNASYVGAYDGSKCYIAAMCPFNEKSCIAFWFMIAQDNVGTIVMVTNMVDEGITKCSQFWPAAVGRREAYGDILVCNTGVLVFADFTIQQLRLSSGAGGGDGNSAFRRDVMLFHFTSWPQHGVPTDPLPFVEFCHVVRSRSKHKSTHMDPQFIAVLCGTGVSTTGVYIAVDTLMDQANQEGVIGVYSAVHRLRQDRIHMVRTLRQYLFVYDVLFEHMISRKMACHMMQLKKNYKQLSAVDRRTGCSGFGKQLVELDQFTPRLGTLQCRTALLPANKAKNRSLDILPPDSHRPTLRTAGGDGNDYINAVFIDSYTEHARYIITQTPLENTVVDFWKLVYEYNVVAIVTLDDDDDDDGEQIQPATHGPLGSWLPQAAAHSVIPHNRSHSSSPSSSFSADRMQDLEAVSASYGPFLVKCNGNPYRRSAKRDLELYHQLRNAEQPRLLRHFRIGRWPLTGDKPPKTAQAILWLLSEVEAWLSDVWHPIKDGASGGSEPPRVLVHCEDGASRSGLFVAASAICERIKFEPCINIFLAVKAIRARRPQAVAGEDQYRFIHRLAWDYYHGHILRRKNVAAANVDETSRTRNSESYMGTDSIHYNDDGEDDDDAAVGDGLRQYQPLVK